MTEKQIETKILDYLKSGEARKRPVKPQKLAAAIDVPEHEYGAFREALRQLMREGRVVQGAGNSIVLPTARQSASGLIIGSYRHNRKGFGFVVPKDPQSHEDIYIPIGQNNDAITGDVVSAKITSRHQRDGKTLFEGRIVEILERTQKHFVGTLVKQGGVWSVNPDGNTFTQSILTPDAAGKHVKPGTKVVVEMTTYPEDGSQAQGVITEVLGREGEKDVDLKSVIVQHNLPGEFPEPCLEQARDAVRHFNDKAGWSGRFDLSDEVICTIDPDDAKDYDDAISLRRREDGRWELGVHIADVSYFVTPGSPLDDEAYKRGNSAYFPGHVIPMLPEVLSNGVCSLQEGVPRLCKSVFITFDEDFRPARAKFANTIIRSARRLRYTEAQAIIDRAEKVPHPDGPKSVEDYDAKVVKLLDDMNHVARKIQKRRLADGQVVLELPEVELVLDEEGKVVGTRPEDTSFTHTLIEMFMVEANEAVARLFDKVGVPFMRRVHPGPEVDSTERFRHFVQAAGYKLPKVLDRKAIQSLLAAVRGKPESFAINLAVLKSLSRAEYSPQPVGHFALASEYYCHYTSPIRRYADLLVHRLLDSYVKAREASQPAGMPKGGRKKSKVELDDVVSYDDLVEIGKHISFTERRADDAERELRQVKILTLLKGRIGDVFSGVVTGITNFGIFVQIREYLIDGLIRYEDLMDDWWDVDDRAGRVRGQRTGQVIGIGDVADVLVVNVDVPRRELNLAVREITSRARPVATGGGDDEAGGERQPPQQQRHRKPAAGQPPAKRGGGRKAPPRGHATPSNAPRGGGRRSEAPRPHPGGAGGGGKRRGGGGGRRR